MSYIGNTNTTQAFTPAVDFFNGNGSTTAFTLSRPVASVAQVQAVISNVPQNPGSAFTVSGNTITFTSAPPSGTANIYVYYTSPITQVIAPGQGTVTSDSFGVITNFTTTGNTVLGDATTDTLNVANGGLIKDASGNLGLGVTPSAWTTYTNVLQTPGVALATNGVTFGLGANWYYDGQNRYKGTGNATLYGQASGAHTWFTSSSGTAGNSITFTQAMTLDASGNVQLGTTNNSGSARRLIIKGSGVSDGAILLKSSSTAEGGTNGFLLQSFGPNNEAYVWNFENQPLIFGTNNSERARIDSSGNLLVGYSSSAQGLIGAYQTANAQGIYVRCTSSSLTNSVVEIEADRNTTNNTFYAITYLNNGAGAYKFRVADSGNVTNTNNSYGAISDIKLKENITDATPKLEKLNQVRVVNYNFIGNDQKQLGVIAQELEQIFPGMVEESADTERVTTTDEDGNEVTNDVPTGTTTKSVKYSVFVPMLIKAMQEQQAIIETLTQRITALESK